MLYRILKFIIGNGMRLYYREIKVKGKNTLNQNGPMIIVANHPNTLIDAWIIAYHTKKPVYYLTKGTFFNNRFKKWILKQLYMIPINRSVDAKTAGVDNRSSFEACYEILEKGETLVIFPEGNSQMENALRELKTGTARIALEIEKRGKIAGPVKICPVGFFYSKGHRFRSSVLANVGKTFNLKDFKEAYLETPTEAAKSATNRIKEALENLIVGTDHHEQETLIERILKAVQSYSQFKNIEFKQNEYKILKQRVRDFQMDHPSLLLELESDLLKIERGIENLKIHPKAIIDAKDETFWMQFIFNPIFILLGFPIFIFGSITNVLPFKITQFIMPRLVTTKEYYAPVAILVGIFLYPLNYSLMVFVFKYTLSLSFIALLSLIPLMAISGIFAFHFSKFLNFQISKIKLHFWRKNKTQTIKQIEESLKNLRTSLFTKEH